MPKDSQHVVRSKDGGGWDVKKSGTSKATKHFATQDEAIEYGQNIAKNQKSELYIHDKDGKIRDKKNFGKDPYPPKG